MPAADNNRFLKTILRHPLLTPEEEVELTYRIREGDESARERMILANLRLVVSIAKSYQHPDISMEEMINEGTLGLMEAIRRFDPAEQCRFSTYATFWVRQALRRAILSHGRAIRIPPYMLEMIAKLKSTHTLLTSRLGRPPTVAEIAAEMGISPDNVVPIQKAMQVTVSANQPAMVGIDASIADGIEDHRFPTPEQQFFRRMDAGVIHDLLASVEEREAEVLRMRYGLEESEPMTLKEIGARMNLTKERVRQIENQAIRKLKRILKTRPGLNP